MDIREILAAIDENDRKLWSECRTAMRKVYLTAHNKVVGLQGWEAQDDAFMDLIDIKLATLFDRSGRLTATKPLIGEKDAEKIEDSLTIQADDIKSRGTKQKGVATLIGSQERFDIATSVPMNEWK